MEKYVIFLNGSYSKDYDTLRRLCEGRTVICADGGINTASKLGLNVSVLIGDLDSANPNTVQYYKNIGTKVFSMIREKDYSDFEECLIYIATGKIPESTGRFYREEISLDSIKDTDILVLGATGKRLDMTLSNLKKLHHLPGTCFVSEYFETIRCISSSTVIRGMADRDFSIIPITDIKNLKLEGFEYNLTGNDISVDLGLASNILRSDEAKITFDSGLMLLIY